jgi:hypothetical protein
MLYDVPVTCGSNQPSTDNRKLFIFNGLWWALQDSNLRLPPCEADN